MPKKTRHWVRLVWKKCLVSIVPSPSTALLISMLFYLFYRSPVLVSSATAAPVTNVRPQLVQIQQPAAAAARIQVRNTQELIGKNLNICSNYTELYLSRYDAQWCVHPISVWFDLHFVTDLESERSYFVSAFKDLISIWASKTLFCKN